MSEITMMMTEQILDDQNDFHDDGAANFTWDSSSLSQLRWPAP